MKELNKDEKSDGSFVPFAGRGRFNETGGLMRPLAFVGNKSRFENDGLSGGLKGLMRREARGDISVAAENNGLSGGLMRGEARGDISVAAESNGLSGGLMRRVALVDNKSRSENNGLSGGLMRGEARGDISVAAENNGLSGSLKGLMRQLALVSNKCLISLIPLMVFVVGFAVFPSVFSEAVHGQTVVNRYPPGRGFFVRRDANSVARDDVILHKVGTSKIYAVMQNDYMPGNRLYVHTAANKHGTLQEYSRHLGVPFVPSQVIHYASNGTKGTDYGTYYTWKYVPHYDYSNLANITIFVGDSDGMESAGNPCQQGIPSSSVGLPVNVLTGNMWLEQTDYSVVGSGGALDLNRFYNTVIQTDGLFGKGWRTQFDESLEAYGDSLVRVNMADGRAVYLGRRDTTSAYNLSPQKYIGEVLKEADGSYRLKLKDGHESKFTAAGRLEWKKDRNGNQTTLTYDTNGNLTKVTDAFGRSLTFTMSGGRVTRVSDALGKVADYVYNTDGTLQSVTYADNSKYSFEYTTINNKKYMTSVKDALNNVLESHSYDNQGRATTSERHGGVDKQTISYGQTSGGKPYTSVTDGLGRVTRYNYQELLSGLKQLVSVVGNCDCGSGEEKTTYEYDNNWNVVKQTDALGNATTYTHDADGNVLTATDVLGTLTYTYNSFGQVLTATDRMGGVTTNTYDAKGNLLTTKDALNNTTTMTYTAKGQPATITDARSSVTTLTYDASGRLTKITDADNKATAYAYDARSRLTSITNALNQKVNYTYDANDRLKRITYPDTNYREFTYDLAGRRTRIRDEKGNNTSFTYDTSYRLTKVTDALNNTVSYSYDLMSNMTSMTDGVGKVTNYQYDNFDRLTKVIYPAASTGATRLEERYEYDAVGNVKKHIDTASRQTLYGYDTSHRLISGTDALNQVTKYEYNARSLLTKVTDAKQQQYVFTYDTLGRRLSQTRDGQTKSYTYDALGNVTKRTDYANRVTNYTYDKLNRLTQISYVGRTAANVTYTYDGLGRMLTAVNSAGTVAFTYNNRGRLTSENDVHSQAVGYGYEANGNRSSLSLNGTNHTTYAYDVVDRLTGLTSAADNTQFTYSYDKADRLTSKVLPNGITTTYEYDGMSRLTRLKDATSVKTHYDRQFTYNTANQISKITEPAKTRNFAYDQINRLTGMTSPTAGVTAESYAYDAVGNRTSSHKSASYTTGTFNKLTGTTNATYTYDANGNMRTKVSGGITWTYSWDYEDRMTSATDGTTTVSYSYDGLGRLTKRTKGTEVIKYTYDGWDVIREDHSVNGITTYQNGLGIDDKLRSKNGTTVRYFLTDHLGSTEALTDATGAITSSTSYDSFGNATSNIATTYRYTGREYDPDIGLYYYRNRWYDPEVGLFISTDPIGFAGGDVNLYRYVWNNPQNFIDPYGHFPDCPLGFGGFGGNRRFNGEPSSGWWDAVQGALDVAGLAPGVGILADLANAGISVARGNYGDAALSMAAAVPVLGTAAGAVKIAHKLNKVTKSATQLERNKAAGAAFEQQVKRRLQGSQTGIVEQVTVKTQSGVRTRIDLLGRDSTGAIRCTECKASATAPLTRNQRLGFPEIQQTGGVVVGKGKPGFPGGTKIPPTKVDIVRPGD